jgi:hypothetical protein
METTMALNVVTRLPARLEPFGQRGWTVFEFATSEQAAEWFMSYPEAAMPCWRRFSIVAGKLVLVR